MTVFLVFGCNRDGSHTGASIFGEAGHSHDGAEPGEFVFSAIGGDGAWGGGDFQPPLAISSISDIDLLNEGTVDTLFTVPAYTFAENLGDVPAIVESSLDEDDNPIPVVVPVDPEEPLEGDLLMRSGSPYLYICTSSYQEGSVSKTVSYDYDTVTGLKVLEGSILILGLNYDDDGYDQDGSNYTGQDLANLNFNNDVIINGTLEVADLASAVTTQGLASNDQRHEEEVTDRDKGSLDLNIAGHLTVGEKGAIDASGDDGEYVGPTGVSKANGDGERGGDGGEIDIDVYSGCMLKGTIDASGGDGDNAEGGNSSVYNSSGAFSCLWIDSYSIVNTGPIDVSGGNGTDGGNAAVVLLWSGGTLTNTGDIAANGGTGSEDSGGYGGGINLWSYASVQNAGDLSTNGGDGAFGGGYAGPDTIYLCAGMMGGRGSVINSGDLSANGGDATDADEQAYGGSAGYIDMEAYGGDVKTSGAIFADGGIGMGSGYYGGSGGYLDIDTYSTNEDATDQGEVSKTAYVDSGYGVAGSIEVTNHISLDGGNGAGNESAYGTAYPGDRGVMFVNAGTDTDGGSEGYTRDLTKAPTVKFVGYSQFDFSGGDALVDDDYEGGQGGRLRVSTTGVPYDENDREYGQLEGAILPGHIVCTVPDIISRGGNGYYGGSGGNIRFRTGNDEAAYDEETQWYDQNSYVINASNMDLSGGGNKDTEYGGNSGHLYIIGLAYAENSGEITMLGGQGGDSGHDYWSYGTGAYYMGGGNSDPLSILSNGNVVNSGDLIATGGAGFYGGSVGDLYIYGDIVTLSGELWFNGGAGNQLIDSDGYGGDGGYIDIWSFGGTTVNTSPAINVDGGAGDTEGDPGEAWIDGALIAGEISGP
jgi:hypothetical protein